MISCILFDFDNTLYDYELVNKIALNKLFDELVLNNNLNKKYLEKYIKNLIIILKIQIIVTTNLIKQFI
jgi:FMN phosphatase YigB (HAD superfamily)